MTLTKHAKQRWSERFSNLSMEHEYTNAVKPKKVVLANIKTQCPEHASMMKRDTQRGLAYKISPNGVVFVCGKMGVIITVFSYVNRGDTSAIKSRKVYRQGEVICSSNVINKW